MKINIKGKLINKLIFATSLDLATILINKPTDSAELNSFRREVLEEDNLMSTLTQRIRSLMILNGNKVDKYIEKYDSGEINTILKSLAVNVLPSRDVAVRYDVPEHILIGLIKSDDIDIFKSKFDSDNIVPNTATFLSRLMMLFSIPKWFDEESNILIKDIFLEDLWSDDIRWEVEMASDKIEDFIKLNLIINIYNSFTSVFSNLSNDILVKEKLQFIDNLNITQNYDLSKVYGALVKQKSFSAINLSSLEVAYSELIKALILDTKLFLDEALSTVKVIKLNLLAYNIDKSEYMRTVEKSPAFSKQYKKIKNNLKELNSEEFTLLLMELRIMGVELDDKTFMNILTDLLASEDLNNPLSLYDIDESLINDTLSFVNKLSTNIVKTVFLGEVKPILHNEIQQISLNKSFNLFSIGLFKENFKSLMANVTSTVAPLIDMKRIVLAERVNDLINDKFYIGIPNILYKSVYLREVALPIDILKHFINSSYDLIIKALAQSSFGKNAGQVPLSLLIIPNDYVKVDQSLNFKIGYSNDKNKFVLYTEETNDLDAMHIGGFNYERVMKINGTQKLNIHYYILDNLLEKDILEININGDYPLTVNKSKELFSLTDRFSIPLLDPVNVTKRTLFKSSTEIAIKPLIFQEQQLNTTNANTNQELDNTESFNFKGLKRLDVLLNNVRRTSKDPVDIIKLICKILNIREKEIIIPSMDTVVIYKYLFLKAFVSFLNKQKKEQVNTDGSSLDAYDLQMCEFKFNFNKELEQYNKSFNRDEFTIPGASGFKSDELIFVINQSMISSLNFRLNELIIQFMNKFLIFTTGISGNIDLLLKVDDTRNIKQFFDKEAIKAIDKNKESFEDLAALQSTNIAFMIAVLLQYGFDVFFDSKLYSQLMIENGFENVDVKAVETELDTIRSLFSNKVKIIELLTSVCKAMKGRNTNFDVINNIISFYQLLCHLIKLPNIFINEENCDQIIGSLLTNMLEFK